ncbi:hypothetical protein [Dyella agri]
MRIVLRRGCFAPHATNLNCLAQGLPALARAIAGRDDRALQSAAFDAAAAPTGIQRLVMELEPETHAHAHKSGHSLVDMMLALSALVLSVVSMIIAIQNHHAMKQLVMANSWPYLQHESSNVSSSGKAVVLLGVSNAGIGPALIDKFTVSYQGTPIKDTSDLLRHCCAKDAGDVLAMKANLITGGINGRAVSAKEHFYFLQMEKPAQGPSLDQWQALDRARAHVSTAVCYGSVLGDHWITTSDDFRPRQVESCDALPGTAFQEE